MSADKAQFSRPQDLFGQFGLQHHVGKSHPHLMGTGKFVGTADSERLTLLSSLCSLVLATEKSVASEPVAVACRVEPS